MLQSRERSLVPPGTFTGLPGTARRVRRLEGTLLPTLARWGYQEIIPPTFEYLDVLSAGLEPEIIENCYKFADRTTGRIILLRPDVTAQIARMVASGILGSHLPLRLCYRSTVFRHEPEHAGRDREIFQVGVELIGVDGVATDAEILALMTECLRELGLTAFSISLGHVGFFKGLLARSGISPEGRKRAEQAAAHKDLPRLEEILSSERLPRKQALGILEAPGLYGREEVLKRGRALAGGHPDLELALERLTQVYRLLVANGMKEHLVLDLGEFRGFDYYDGIAFDVFGRGVGYELGGGGRYNDLLGRFGRDIPSTGFALDVDRVFQALEGLEERVSLAQADVLVVAPSRVAERLFFVAGLLRQAGFRVVQEIIPDREPHSERYAAEVGQRLGASSAVLLGPRRASTDEALVATDLLAFRDVPTHKRQPRGQKRAKPKKPVYQAVKIKDLPLWLARALEQAQHE